MGSPICRRMLGRFTYRSAGTEGRLAQARPPALLTVSHIRLIALDGAFETGAAVVDVILRRRYVGVS
jgi:hypothetical protein